MKRRGRRFHYFACPTARESRRSLAGALTIAFGLIGIDLAHAFEEFFGVGFLDLGRTRSVAATAAPAGTSWLRFLYPFWHNCFLFLYYLLHQIRFATISAAQRAALTWTARQGRLALPLYYLCKFQLREILDRLRGANHFQALTHQIWVEEISQIKFNFFRRALQ